MNFDPFLSKTSATETTLNQPGLGGELCTSGPGSLRLVGRQVLSSRSRSPLLTLLSAEFSWGISVLVFLLSAWLSFIGHLARVLDLEERAN